MATTTPSTVPTNEVGRYLTPLLAGLIALALNGKQAHWHVHGRTFTQIHGQLDGLVGDARTYADEVAERAVTLGVAVDGRPAQVASQTDTPSFPTGFLDGDKVVRAISDQLDATITRARAAVGPLGELDPVTQDVVLDALRGLEKHRWMFNAQVS